MRQSQQEQPGIHRQTSLWDQSSFRNRSHMQKNQNKASQGITGFRQSGFDRLGHPDLPLGHVTPKLRKSKEKLTYGNLLIPIPVKAAEIPEFLESHSV